MNKNEIQQVAHKRKVVDRVLQKVASVHGCPCKWPQFEYWGGKEQGPGWQDNIQNDLVESALALACFIKSRPVVPEYALAAELTCANCAAKWKHFSREWRMLAFHKRLVRVEPKSSGNRAYENLIGADIFATVGLEPKEGLQSLSLNEWAEFMLGRPYQAEPYQRPKI